MVWCKDALTLVLYVFLLRTGDSELDPDLWKAGLRQVVYREPALRADVDLASEPVSWRPARDFSDVFRLQDLRDSGCENLEADTTL